MKKITIIACILWMGFIFHMSSNTGIISNDESHKIVHFIQQIANKLSFSVKNTDITQINHIVRKNGHVLEYIILAILAGTALFTYNLKGKKAVIYILFICLFYAVTDEFHQMFVPGRTSLVSDVLIDFSGAILGIGIYYLLYYKVYLKHNHG